MIDLMSCVYKEGGREYPEYDCYGLVLAVRDRLGMPKLPEYSDIRKGRRMQAAFEVESPLRVKCEAKQGAVAICWRSGIVQHIAVVVEIDGELRVMEINPIKNVTHQSVAAFERKFPKVDYYE